MNTDFTNLTTENLSNEHLCCIIRSKKSHPGIEAKRQWLSDRLNEGHVFRKLNAKATVFIEYAPLETAWVPVIGDNYYYLYCLWVLGSPRGNGYGKALIEYCIADAKEKGRSGICMLGALHIIINRQFLTFYFQIFGIWRKLRYCSVERKSKQFISVISSVNHLKTKFLCK